MLFLFVLLIMVVSSDAGGATSNPSQRIEASDDSAYVKGITPARARSLAGGVLGLLSVVIGLRAKVRRPSNAGTSGYWSMTAIIMGIVSVILSVIHLALNTGDFGTGGGKAGAIVGLLLGLIGGMLGTLAFRKHPRN